MQKTKSYLSLFAPSSLGVVFYVFLAALAIVLNQFGAIQKVLQLPGDLEYTRALTGWINRVLTSVIGESRTETLVVGLFWAFVGLLVYVFLQSLSKLASELDDDIGSRGYVWPKGTNRSRPLQLFVEKVIFRIVALAALLLVIIGPLAAVISHPVFVGFIGTNKPVQYLVWFIAGVIVWHIVVVLVRLVALRARLFG